MNENDLTKVRGATTQLEGRSIQVANRATISLAEAAGILGIAVTERPEQKAETPVKQSTKNKSAAKYTVADARDDEKPNISNQSLMISLGDAAQMLGIHRTTAWAIHDRGDFPVPVIKVGGHWRVVRAHLHHFINTGERVTLPFNPVSDSTSTAR
jgi:predicted DNA-binding transcriptional regulator AlpA